MDLKLKGKNVLVTGSSQGIGKSIGLAFYNEGANVIFHGRDRKKLSLFTDELIRAHVVTGDITTPDGAKKVCDSAIKFCGELDVLVCNVGSGISVKPGDESFCEWQRVFGLNFWSTTNMVEFSKASLIKTAGSIVCISSICGLESIENAPITYSAAKAALNSYVKGISRPLGNHNVRINAIAPGNILFEGSSWHQKMQEKPAYIESIIDSTVPLKCFGETDDVASLCTYLASSISRFVTGSIWTVDGGQTH